MMALTVLTHNAAVKEHADGKADDYMKTMPMLERKLLARVGL